MTSRRRIRSSRPPSAGAGPARDARVDGAEPAGGQSSAEEPASRRVAGTRAVPIGRVTHYFARAGAAVVALEGPLAVGDLVHVHGASTDLVQAVTRLERRGRSVRSARAGEEIGLAVAARVRPRDRVDRLEDAGG
jgi:hypothetical protein